MENYLAITGAWVGPEPHRGSWSNPTPVCRVKEGSDLSPGDAPSSDTPPQPP